MQYFIFIDISSASGKSSENFHRIVSFVMYVINIKIIILLLFYISGIFICIFKNNETFEKLEWCNFLIKEKNHFFLIFIFLILNILSVNISTYI